MNKIFINDVSITEEFFMPTENGYVQVNPNRMYNQNIDLPPDFIRSVVIRCHKEGEECYTSFKIEPNEDGISVIKKMSTAFQNLYRRIEWSEIKKENEKTVSESIDCLIREIGLDRAKLKEVFELTSVHLEMILEEINKKREVKNAEKNI